MKRIFSQLQTAGFTLIEMIVSLALFSVVVTIAVGALLILIASNEQLQQEQSVMTNLSFALDSMSREIRTGENYFCRARANYSAGGSQNFFNNDNNLDDILGSDRVRNCWDGNTGNRQLQGIAFTEGGDSVSGASERILYFFDRDEGKIFRRVGNEDAQSIVSSGIFITDAEFFVTGAAPLSDGPTNSDQASVTIFIEAKESDNPSAKAYQIQTTVTQRALDV